MAGVIGNTCGCSNSLRSVLERAGLMTLINIPVQLSWIYKLMFLFKRVAISAIGCGALTLRHLWLESFRATQTRTGDAGESRVVNFFF